MTSLSANDHAALARSSALRAQGGTSPRKGSISSGSSRASAPDEEAARAKRPLRSVPVGEPTGVAWTAESAVNLGPQGMQYLKDRMNVFLPDGDVEFVTTPFKKTYSAERYEQDRGVKRFSDQRDVIQVIVAQGEAAYMVDVVVLPPAPGRQVSPDDLNITVGHSVMYVYESVSMEPVLATSPRYGISPGPSLGVVLG